MDDNPAAAPADLRDAALVHAARREIDTAIAALAASPLDEAAAEQMRRVLARGDGARAALNRLGGPSVGRCDRGPRPVVEGGAA